MSVLKTELLVIFSIITASVFLWRFSRDKVMADISFGGIAPALKVLLAIVVPVGALMFAGGGISPELPFAAPFFIGAVALPMLLSQIGLPPFLRSLLLLAGAVAFTCFVPIDHYQGAVAAAVAGLVCWKSADNLLLNQEKSTLEDFIPPFLWLVSILWTKTVDAENWLAPHQNMILASFVAGIFMRWIQDPFLKVDKLYVKRLCLAVTGGLVLLCLVTKVVVALELAKLCVIAGGGYLLTYMLQAMDQAGENDSVAMKSFKQLLFLGIFTLLATRLYFTPGLIVLAISTMIATRSGGAAIAGVYFGSYIFLQTFIFKFNSNMTGINVMHPYTSAALYAGLLIAITASLLIRERMDSRSRTLLFISATLIAPAATSYFLHAEPAASLLLATLVGSVIIGMFARALANSELKGYDNVMLVPAQMIAVGLLTGDLIATGNVADSQQRMTALIGLAVACSAVLGIASFMSRQNTEEVQPAAPVVEPPADIEVIGGAAEVQESEKEETAAEAETL